MSSHFRMVPRKAGAQVKSNVRMYSLVFGLSSRAISEPPPRNSKIKSTWFSNDGFATFLYPTSFSYHDEHHSSTIYKMHHSLRFRKKNAVKRTFPSCVSNIKFPRTVGFGLYHHPKKFALSIRIHIKSIETKTITHLQEISIY
jgi:hypothetical protein